LRRERIELVQTFFEDSSYFAVPAAKLAGVRSIVRTRRNLGYWLRPIDRWLGRLYNRVFVDAMVVNCDACRQAVIVQEGIAASRVTIVENGIDLGPFEAVPPLSPAGNGRTKKVGIVANLRPIKGPEVLIAAAKLVAQSFPDVVFRVAGAVADSVRRFAEESGIADRIEFAGRISDVPAFLSELDVAVLTSHSEGFSNALLEYMAAGRPVVATAVGAASDVIEDGVQGLLAPPGNPQAVASAIGQLLGNPALAARMGAAGRQRAFQRYSLEGMVRRHEELYGDLVRASRAKTGRKA
jgi:glycosyltransferase involved in cell wall biosynthesis